MIGSPHEALQDHDGGQPRVFANVLGHLRRHTGPLIGRDPRRNNLVRYTYTHPVRIDLTEFLAAADRAINLARPSASVGLHAEEIHSGAHDRGCLTTPVATPAFGPAPP